MNARFAFLLPLTALTLALACGSQRPSVSEPHTVPTQSAAPSGSTEHSAPEASRPAGYSLQQAVVRLRERGATPRQRLSPDFTRMAPRAQERRVAAWSATSVGTDTSRRVTLRASVRMPSPPEKSARQVALTFELPEAEQHLTSRLLGASFEDRSEAPFLGFSRAILPSVLIDIAPDGELGVGATWSVDRRYQDGAGEFFSRRNYKLLRWVAPDAFGIRQTARIAELELVWVDGAERGSEQVTTGRIWHSAAWLYPVGYFRQKIEEDEITLETMLQLDNPEWPKLSPIVAKD